MKIPGFAIKSSFDDEDICYDLSDVSITTREAYNNGDSGGLVATARACRNETLSGYPGEPEFCKSPEEIAKAVASN